MLKYYTKLKHYMGRFFYVTIHLKLNFCHLFGKKTLPKAQLTQGIEDVDSINIFRSKQKLQQALHLGQTSAWFCLAKSEKCKEQLWRIHVTTLRNTCINLTNSCKNLKKCMRLLWKIQQFNSAMFKILVDFTLVLSGKGQEIHVTTLTNLFFHWWTFWKVVDVSQNLALKHEITKYDKFLIFLCGM